MARILFVDATTGLETVFDLGRRGRGGMVASLFKVSDYLARKGHDVTVLSDIKCTGVTPDGVKWLHETWGQYDALVCNRGVGDGYPQIDAKRRILWTHDLPHSGFIPNPKTIRGFDRTVFMSRYAERIWRTFYKDIGRSVIIPNGVDRGLFFDRGKVKDYLIYASAPNRGLEWLPFIQDAVQTRIGRKVHLVAYSNLAKLHPKEGKDTFDYKSIEESDVNLRDPVPQRKLAEELGKAVGLVMPSDYPEICSNVILQALASSTPVFTTGGLGYVDEWVKHGKNGFTTRFGPWDYMTYQVEFIRNLVDYLGSNELQRKVQDRAALTRVWNWDQVGAAWHRLVR